MFSCYLKDIKSDVTSLLSDSPIEVRDNREYLIIVVYEDGNATESSPITIIGDVEINMRLVPDSNDLLPTYSSVDGSFFDNAIFLNYFGECELSISIDDYRVSYIVQVNVTGYKAAVAKEMLEFLSENSEDILQTCYSKSKVGYSNKFGAERELIKINVLEKTVSSIEKLFLSFQTDRKYEIKNQLTQKNNKPVIVDEASVSWLSENFDEVELVDSSSYKFKIKNKYYQANIPSSVTYFDTDLKENRVLHKFTLTALSYLNRTKASLMSQLKGGDYLIENEYSDYIKFDQVIKNILKPILDSQIKKVDGLISRISKINAFFKKNVPVNGLLNAMPVQTKFTLRHRHYGIAFNEISKFYRSSDADKKELEFLLGLRNLSQLFELSCLFCIVKYFNGFSDQKSAIWSKQSYSWNGENSEVFNVLANEFKFESSYYEYTVLYEKTFFSLNSSKLAEQENNLIRVDQKRNFCVPDFVIKVRSKSNSEFYFVILDAKFSRRYKMTKNKEGSIPSTLQSNYNKYATNLMTYKNGSMVNLTRYVGVLYGLSKDESERSRVNMFNEAHDIDGVAPLFPFSAADYISFSNNTGTIDRLLNLYIQR